MGLIKDVTGVRRQVSGWRRFLAVLALCSLTSCGAPTRQPGEYTLGAVLPLTGAFAHLGHEAKHGIDLALEEINASAVLTKPLRVAFFDDRASPMAAVTGIRSLATRERVPLVLGPLTSACTLAASPAAEQTRTILLTPSATADGIADSGPLIFAMAPPDSRQGYIQAEFARTELKRESAVILQTSDEFALTLASAFHRRFEGLGGEVLLQIVIEQGTSDLRAPLHRIEAHRPDVVFFALLPWETSRFLRQARDTTFETAFLGTEISLMADLLAMAEDAAEGSYYSRFATIPSRKTDASNQTSVESLGPLAAGYYDATRLAADALRAIGPSPEAIRDYLLGLDAAGGFMGVTGRIAFDSNGATTRSHSVYEVMDGSLQLVWSLNPITSLRRGTDRSQARRQQGIHNLPPSAGGPYCVFRIARRALSAGSEAPSSMARSVAAGREHARTD